MKQVQRLASVVLVITIGTASQPGQAWAEQGLEQRTREYEEALTKRDIPTLDKIWASEYTFINPRGELVTKAQRIANLKSGATEFRAMNSQREKLQVHGDMAIDIGRFTVQGRYGGQESSGEYRYMDIWRKNQGQWQLLANQITPIKAKRWSSRPAPN
jgi:ketosteroid isomerase-like protein